MSKRQHAPSRIPEFKTVQDAAEFWDTHSTTEFEDEWEPVDLEVDPRSKSVRRMEINLDYSLYTELRARAEKQEMTAEKLAEHWLEATLAAPPDESAIASSAVNRGVGPEQRALTPHWPQWSEVRWDATVFRTVRNEIEFCIVLHQLPDGQCEVQIMSRRGQGAWTKGAYETLACAEAERRIQSMKDDPEAAFMESIL